MGKLPKHGRVEVTVDAPVEAVWNVVADVTRTGEWSHECEGSTWLAGATSARPGARFRGRNRHGRARWSRTCEILEVEEPHRLRWRTVPSAMHPDETVWQIALEPVAGGTRIVQRYAITKIGAVADRVYCLVVPAHRDRLAALTADVERIGAVARTDRADLLS